MNVILGAEIQNGVVLIRKVGAVVDEFNETKIDVDLNKTTLTDWMGVLIKDFVLSASCKIQKTNSRHNIYFKKLIFYYFIDY